MGSSDSSDYEITSRFRSLSTRDGPGVNGFSYTGQVMVIMQLLQPTLQRGGGGPGGEEERATLLSLYLPESKVSIQLRRSNGDEKEMLIKETSGGSPHSPLEC